MGNIQTNTKALDATKATSSQTWLYIVITWESLKYMDVYILTFKKLDWTINNQLNWLIYKLSGH